MTSTILPEPPLVTSEEVRRAARRIPALDWLMLALALASIVLLLWDALGTLDPVTYRRLVIADYVICGLFATEFVWRWRADGWSGRYLRRNWYELLGMIPVQHPLLRSLRLLRIVILLARFGMAADRAFGDEFTYRVVSRFKRGIVDSIRGAVTLAVIEEIESVLVRGTYTRNLRRVLQENQLELRAMVMEKLRQDKHAGRLSKLPFYNDIVQSVIDGVMRMGEEFLRDPRTDELVADLLRENLQQIRAAVAQKEAARQRAARGRHDAEVVAPL